MPTAEAAVEAITAPTPTAAPVDATPPAEPAPAEGGAETPAPKPAESAPPTPKTWRLKVDGQDLDVDEAELTRGYQRAAAANRRFEEAVKARQEAEQIRSGIAKDWRAALKAAGIDPREAAKQEILAAIQEEQRQAQEAQLPQEVRAQLERARAVERELAEIKAKQEAATKEQLSAEAKQYVERFNVEIPKAMEAAGLPKTVEAARLVMAKAHVMTKAGMPLDFGAAAQAAREELEGRNFAVLRALSPAALVKALGKDAIDGILRYSIEQAKGAPPPPKAPAAAPKKPERPWMTEREAAKYLTE